MKTLFTIFQWRKAQPPFFRPRCFASLTSGLWLGFWLMVAGPATCQPAATNAPGQEVQTRGPVHEAFAGIVAFNPTPGIVVTKAPPQPIEEIPPQEKPQGDNVTWIPGYWGWDDDRSDF